LPIDDTTPPVTNTNFVGLRLIARAISITLQQTQGSMARAVAHPRIVSDLHALGGAAKLPRCLELEASRPSDVSSS
jgi:hypothetical protein